MNSERKSGQKIVRIIKSEYLIIYIFTLIIPFIMFTPKAFAQYPFPGYSPYAGYSPYTGYSLYSQPNNFLLSSLLSRLQSPLYRPLYNSLYTPLWNGLSYGQGWGLPTTGLETDYLPTSNTLSPEEYLLYQGYSNYYNWTNNLSYLGRLNNPFSLYNPILEPLNPIGQYIGKMNQTWYDLLPDKWKPQPAYDENGNQTFSTMPQTPWGYGIPGFGVLCGQISVEY